MKSIKVKTITGKTAEITPTNCSPSSCTSAAAIMQSTAAKYCLAKTQKSILNL